MKKTILAIETSCDDTGIAIVEAEWRLPAGRQGFSKPKFKVIENLVSSQIKIHRPFGGVVPNLAKREHIKNLPILYRKISRKWQMANGLAPRGLAKRDKLQGHKRLAISYKPDMIAVTVGPGLEPALWTGINFAKTLTRTDDALTNMEKSQFKSVPSPFKSVPLIGVNHLEGHLYSFLLPKSIRSSMSKVQNKTANLEPRTSRTSNMFPSIALLVSGGHTAILLLKNLKEWKILGETRDDAAGEAFDKVARMLKLPYPGGPEIEKISKKGNADAIEFPRPMLNQKNYDFSFSGLKTSVFYYLRDIRVNSDFSGRFKADVAASFQKAVVEVLITKTARAAKEHGARSVILCGGVAANKSLRKMLKVKCDMSHLKFYAPHAEYNNDNAAMIAAAAYMSLSHKKKYKLEANGDLNI